MSDMTLVTLSESDLGKVRTLCGHSPTYRKGYDAKMEWLRLCLQEGMHYTLAQVNGWNAGMIEYLPAEYAWRGVDADGYMFIHCLWVVGRNRKHGYGRQLLDACLQESHGTHGVAVLSSKTHWLPTRRIFLKNGFEVVDEVPPFELLAKRFDPQALLPRIRRNTHPFSPGLTLYYSDQCPYMQNMPLIVERVGEQLDVPVKLVHLQTARQAQESPCPYGVLGIFYNGELLDYRPIGSQSLVELLKKKMETQP
jgi:GNAT superfamily N-acetyltransferase